MLVAVAVGKRTSVIGKKALSPEGGIIGSRRRAVLPRDLDELPEPTLRA